MVGSSPGSPSDAEGSRSGSARGAGPDVARTSGAGIWTGPGASPWTRVAALLGLVALGVLFVVHATDAYYLCDDAYISFRYAWHLVHGNGLVFNVGERVEGYTNFAWVLELSAVWKLFGVPPEVACTWLSSAASLVALIGIGALALTGPWEKRRGIVLFAALLLLATSRSWAQWTSSGLETRQFTALIVVGVALLAGLARPWNETNVGAHAGDPRSSRAQPRIARAALASIAFAWAEWTRPEGLMFGACAAAWLAALVYVHWRPARELVAFVVPFAVLVGGHYLWRHAYYDEWLPNTYYAKFVRPWPEMGLAYLATAYVQRGMWLMVPLALVASVSRLRRRDATHVLVLVLLALHSLYLIHIGGDNLGLRPFDVQSGLLMVPAVEGAMSIASLLTRRRWLSGEEATGERESRVVRLARAALAGFLILACIVYGRSIQLAKAKSSLKYQTRESARRLTGELDPEWTELLSWIPGMPLLLADYDSLQEYTTSHGVGTLWRVDERLWREEVSQFGPYASLRGSGLIPSSAVTARISTGIMGYYLTDVTVIDLVGLTDRTVARTPVTKSNSERVFAHDRAATPDYLKSRGVNISIHGATPSLNRALESAQFALRAGDDLWMPFDSRDPEWVRRSFPRDRVWTWHRSSELACLEPGDERWTMSGPAFEFAPHELPVMFPTAKTPARCTGAIGFDTRDQRHGDTPGNGTGTATSPAFRVPEGARFEVRMATSPKSQCGVRLVDEQGLVVAQLDGLDDSALSPRTIDLEPWLGSSLRVVIFDESDKGWIAACDAVVLRPATLSDGVANEPTSTEPAK